MTSMETIFIGRSRRTKDLFWQTPNIIEIRSKTQAFAIGWTDLPADYLTRRHPGDTIWQQRLGSK